MVTASYLEDLVIEDELAAVVDEQSSEKFDDVDTSEDSNALTSEKELQEAALQMFVQRNDFLLPNLIDMLRTHKTLEVAPYYQRRARWDNGRRSRLIESFLINIPVPPVFLYENEFARYEIMDGQQRVSSVLQFFENQFALSGLEILTSLNGKRFHDLPGQVRAGLERRSLSAIILLKESAPSQESMVQLRRHVFEHLNTGGIRLNAQEVRNCVNAGLFNDLLLDLSRHPMFTDIWDIPPFAPDEQTEPSVQLRNNSLYRRMADVELVLRVFALMDPRNVSGGMKRTLDDSMAKYSKLTTMQLEELRTQFLQSLHLTHVLGGSETLRVPSSGSGRGRPSASLFDGIMVALIRNLDQAEAIEAHALKLKELIQGELNKDEFRELVTGRANTRQSTLDRSVYIEELIKSVICS